jgi:hypothetical protein
MKTAKYEATPGALVALLATRQFVSADLYTFTLAAGGTPLRYTTADTDMGYSGNVWTHGGPLFDKPDQRALAHWKVGLDTDTWQCLIAPRPIDPISGAAYPDMIGDVPWLAAARGGALDGAVVQVDRAFLPVWPTFPRNPVVTPIGVVNIFTGRVATLDIGRSAIGITINSHLELLDTQMPRNLYGSGCRHLLYDQGCQLPAASYRQTGVVAAGSTASVVLSTVAAPSGSGTYALGSLVGTSGKNAGFGRSIRSWSPGSGGSTGSFTLLSPLPFTPQPGDQFNVFAGCDKQLGTCGAFGNTPNFGGMPYIPPPETST